jgi:glycosyltransferase involved in cell wall biosynthesis
VRLAVDATALHDARTGIGVVTHELLARLAGRPDVEVVAFSVSWRGRRSIGDLVPPGVAVASRPMAARPLRAAWRRAGWPPIEWWTGRVDAVLGTNFVVPPTGAGVARVAVVHDLTAWRFPELCTADTLQYPALVARAVTSGAHVVSPSHFVAGEVVERIGARPDAVHAVPWAAGHAGTGDAGRGRVLAGGRRYVLSLGTIEPRKDHALLVRAFDQVAAGDPGLRLVVAGPDGWGVEQYEAAVARARHRDRIVRLGYVDDTSRADLLAGATTFAYPSVYEGFGLPPLEALAAGVPVVTTDVGALREVVGTAADLVPVGDASALADALIRVLALDDDQRAARAERGRRLAAARSWDDVAADVLAVVTAAVAERRTIPGP